MGALGTIIVFIFLLGLICLVKMGECVCDLISAAFKELIKLFKNNEE